MGSIVNHILSQHGAAALTVIFLLPALRLIDDPANFHDVWSWIPASRGGQLPPRCRARPDTLGKRDL